MKTSVNTDAKSKPSKRGAGRPSGLSCPWLREWASSHLKSWASEAYNGSVINTLAVALEKDESQVGRYLKGDTGIDQPAWQGALQRLVDEGRLSSNGFQEFVERCEKTRAGQGSHAERLVDYFTPIQSRLIASLERGAKTSEMVTQAYEEACGLIGAWVLKERQFTPEQLRLGVPEVVTLTDRWFWLSVGIDCDAVEEVKEGLYGISRDAEEGAPPEYLSVAGMIDPVPGRVRAKFQRRLSWWVQSMLPASPEAQEVLKTLQHRRQWDGYRFGTSPLAKPVTEGVTAE